MSDDLGSALRQRRQAEQAILKAYRVATPATLSRTLLIEYRCGFGKGERCLLFRAWQSPSGRLYYVPGYHLSPAREKNESSPSGRQKNKVSGRWRDRAGNLDELLSFGHDASGAVLVLPDGNLSSDYSMALVFQCDHTTARVTLDQLRADLQPAKPGRPTRVNLVSV